MNYSEQIKHPLWQKKRLEILQLFNFECNNCEDKEQTLHVHHKYYTENKKIWEYDDNCYEVLCSDCHQEITKLDKNIKNLLSSLSVDNKYEIYGFLFALHTEYISDVGNCQLDVAPGCNAIEFIEGFSKYLRIGENFFLDNWAENKNFNLKKFQKKYVSTLRVMANEIINYLGK